VGLGIVIATASAAFAGQRSGDVIVRASARMPRRVRVS
jgi:hypothetical protein